MKNRTALKHSVKALKFLIIACPLAILLFVLFPGAGTGIIAGILLLSLVADAVNVYVIRKNARRDPGSLNRHIPGT